MIVHAGDVGRPDVLDSLRQVAPVVVVEGNIDVGRWTPPLPATEVIDIEGILIYVLHDLKTLDLNPAVAGFRCVISGHSHQPGMEKRGDVLYLNPGSAGPQRFKLPISVAFLYIDGQTLDAELVELSI